MVNQSGQNEEIIPPFSEDDRMMAALCYPFWFIVSPIVLLTSKKKELYLYFHALQGLYLGIVSLVSLVLSSLFIYLVFFHRHMTTTMSGHVQVDKQIGIGIISVFVFIFYLLAVILFCLFVFWIAWKASTGKIFRFPFIGEKAYAKVCESRSEEEKQYLDSLTKEGAPGGKAAGGLPEAKVELNPYLFQEQMPRFASSPIPGDEQNAPPAIPLNPAIDRIKQIFSQSEEVAENNVNLNLPPGSDKEDLFKQVLSPSDRKPAFSSENIPALQKGQFAESPEPTSDKGKTPGFMNYRSPEAPTEQLNRGYVKPERVLSPQEQLEMLRKKFDETQQAQASVKPGLSRGDQFDIQKAPGQVEPARREQSSFPLSREPGKPAVPHSIGINPVETGRLPDDASSPSGIVTAETKLNMLRKKFEESQKAHDKIHRGFSELNDSSDDIRPRGRQPASAREQAAPGKREITPEEHISIMKKQFEEKQNAFEAKFFRSKNGVQSEDRGTSAPGKHVEESVAKPTSMLSSTAHIELMKKHHDEGQDTKQQFNARGNRSPADHRGAPDFRQASSTPPRGSSKPAAGKADPSAVAPMPAELKEATKRGILRPVDQRKQESPLSLLSQVQKQRRPITSDMSIDERKEKANRVLEEMEAKWEALGGMKKRNEEPSKPTTFLPSSKYGKDARDV